MVVAIMKGYIIFVIILMLLYTARHFYFTIVRLLGRQRLYYNDILTDRMKSISVLIPMHNEEQVLSNVLDSLLKCEYDRDRLEIIPINDNSTDRTREMLDEYHRKNVAESYTTSMAGGGNRVISGIIGMVPVTFIVNTNVDRNDIDHPLHLYHRIELTFSTGRLCLVNTHGPVIWLPFLHMPRDEYGTLSINVEEEVNIPSGVTIGNVMLPSVKETFEQIWPDAVKKALEILFKQNRTEKMSMAQYQIYVSKLWSEICQKVGYMNIVDYDNFGDIKSIFYDLEKRHLIKKENDGIE